MVWNSLFSQLNTEINYICPSVPATPMSASRKSSVNKNPKVFGFVYSINVMILGHDHIYVYVC